MKYKILVISFVILLGGLILQKQFQTINNQTVIIEKINRTTLSIANKVVTEATAAATEVNATKVAEEIRTEAIKAFNGEKSLPLLTYLPNSERSDIIAPASLLERVKQGEHILVSWMLDTYDDMVTPASYYQASILEASLLNLPLVFVIKSPESVLLTDSYFKNVPNSENPSVVGVDGSTSDKLSPFAPDSVWYEAGSKWAQNTMLQTIQSWYPNPPLVIFVSIDSTEKLTWVDAEQDFRYPKLYGADLKDDVLRSVINANWVEKYRQLHKGFIDHLQSEEWASRSKFISANQLSEDMGMDEDWYYTSTVTNRFINVWPMTANGLNLNFSLEGNKNLTSTNSPNIEANNLAFMLEKAKEDNPSFVSMIALDDANLIHNSYAYKGFGQFALWFLHPNIITKKDNTLDPEEREDHFNVLADAVEAIYENATLKEFWLNGSLVTNGKSPYNTNVPVFWQNSARWFLLENDTNPNRAWTDNDDIGLWAFAIENASEARGSETDILLLLLSTDTDSANGVEVTIPGYGNTTLDATQDGTFTTLNGIKFDSSSSPHLSSSEAISSSNNNTALFAVNSSDSSIVSNSSISVSLSAASVSNSSSMSSAVSSDDSSDIGSNSSVTESSSASTNPDRNTSSVPSSNVDDINVSNSTANISPTTLWPFNQPSITTLRQSSKKVFAHYFSPFPISIDNKDSSKDYYTLGFLDPHGENDKHLAYGGFFRERPNTRPIRSDSNWQYLDMELQVKNAIKIGLDGFTYNMLASSGTHWTRLLLLLDAAHEVDPGFKIALMPDMMSEFRSNPENLVPSIIALSEHPSVMRDENNRIVLAPYNAQIQSAEWWEAQIASLREKGIEVKFMPVFQGWRTYAEAFSSISDGFSDWGTPIAASYLSSSIRSQYPKICHELGKMWMASVRPQDFRPKSFLNSEAHNSMLFRNTWDVAIQGDADWVQIVTWNDYSEASEIAPSTLTNSVFYDLASYYVTWFKTGSKPGIVRDTIYGVYRTQPTDATPTKQLKPFKINGTASNEIELLAFLKKPATLEIQIDDKIFHQQATEGMTSFRVPLSKGTPIFRVIRENNITLEVAGKQPIVFDNIEYQNLLYHGVSKVSNE